MAPPVACEPLSGPLQRQPRRRFPFWLPLPDLRARIQRLFYFAIRINIRVVPSLSIFAVGCRTFRPVCQLSAVTCSARASASGPSPDPALSGRPFGLLRQHAVRFTRPARRHPVRHRPAHARAVALFCALFTNIVRTTTDHVTGPRPCLFQDAWLRRPGPGLGVPRTQDGHSRGQTELRQARRGRSQTGDRKHHQTLNK